MQLFTHHNRNAQIEFLVLVEFLKVKSVATEGQSDSLFKCSIFRVSVSISIKAKTELPLSSLIPSA